MSQKKQVLNYLKDGGSLNSISAFQLCKATRLSDLIFKLRKDGYLIRTEMVGQGQKKYAKYSLINVNKVL